MNTEERTIHRESTQKQEHSLERGIKRFDYLYKQLDDAYHAIARKIGISDGAFIVLYSIAECGGGCQQKDIAEHYSVSRQTVNSATKSLAEKGYIHLTPGKGREMRLTFTPKGADFAEKQILPILSMENAAFAVLPPIEQEQLLQLAGKYVDAFTRATKEFLSQR